jgi:hypothetical protein
VLNIYNIKDSRMKLQELDARKTHQKVTRVLESHFGQSVSFDRLTPAKARVMLRRVRGLVQEHRQTTARHFSETDPAYLRLVMMEQALTARLKEEVPATSSGSVIPNDQKTDQDKAAETMAKINKTKDPAMRMALTKAHKGMGLTQQERQKLATSAMKDPALAQTESYLRRVMGRYKKLTESEVQQAQVVLAAQDMVDNIQGMIEDATEMQFKELPALVDSIRNQIGMEQAVQFQQDATAALTGLVQNLQGTKTSLEQGLGVVTGQETMAPGLDAAMGGEPPPGAEPPIAAEPEAGDEEELDLSLDANIEEPEQEPAAGRLGRERR